MSLYIPPRFFKPHARYTPSSTINIIPLVDVLLVLLVVLLVAAPTLLHTLRTGLPRAEATPLASSVAPIVLTLTDDGQLLWNGETIQRESLQRRLETLKLANPPLLIAASPNIPFEAVAQLMATIHRAGLTNIQFLLDPRS